MLYLYKPDGTAEVSTVPAGDPRRVAAGGGEDRADRRHRPRPESIVSTGTQPNGMKWVRYNGHLLYGFTGDAAPGDTNGNGVGGIWYAVTAAGDAVAS